MWTRELFRPIDAHRRSVYRSAIYLGILILTALFRVADTNEKSLDLRHLGRGELEYRADGIPSSPPWVYPGAVPPMPQCMPLNGTDDCPVTSLADCSGQKCTVTLFGGCVTYTTLVNKSCQRV